MVNHFIWIFWNWIPPSWMVRDPFLLNRHFFSLPRCVTLRRWVSCFQIVTKPSVTRQAMSCKWWAVTKETGTYAQIMFVLYYFVISRLVDIRSFEWGFTMNRMIVGINSLVTRIALGHVGACRCRVCVFFWEPEIADRVSNEILGEVVP